MRRSTAHSIPAVNVSLDLSAVRSGCHTALTFGSRTQVRWQDLPVCSGFCSSSRSRWSSRSSATIWFFPELGSVALLSTALLNIFTPSQSHVNFTLSGGGDIYSVWGWGHNLLLANFTKGQHLQGCFQRLHRCILNCLYILYSVLYMAWYDAIINSYDAFVVYCFISCLVQGCYWLVADCCSVDAVSPWCRYGVGPLRLCLFHYSTPRGDTSSMVAFLTKSSLSVPLWPHPDFFCGRCRWLWRVIKASCHRGALKNHLTPCVPLVDVSTSLLLTVEECKT